MAGPEPHHFSHQLMATRPTSGFLSAFPRARRDSLRYLPRRASALLLDTSYRAAVVMYHGRGLVFLFPTREPGTTTAALHDSLGCADTFPRSICASALHGAALHVFVSRQANFVLNADETLASLGLSRV